MDVIRIIAGQQEWYERIFREKALRLITIFGRNFDVSIDEIEDTFGERQEVTGETLLSESEFHSDDHIIGTCRL